MERLKDFLVSYLANVIMVSRVDGRVEPEEERVIEMIRCGIGAGPDEVNRAIEKVERGEHTLTPVGRFSDKVRNFEDMLLVALIDNDLVLPEKTEILTFAKEINLAQEQIDAILSETRQLVNALPSEEKCPSCGTAQPSEAKFCVACGARL